MASASNVIIQCTSSSSFEYDVFVSFRGEDTHNNFTGFLFEALKKQGIEAFKDDKDIRKGESIAPELIRAIEGSHVFLVVFSKDCASSTWCLRELAHIWNCIQTSPRHLLPIFYDVDPSQVRKQSGDYEKAFSQHQQSFRFQEKEIKTWREVLEQVASLSGTLGVQKQLFSQSLNERNLEIRNISDGTLLAWKRLPNAKTFTVLDNVDKDKQLDMFIGVEIPDAIGIICCLEWLDLSGNNFATLPNLKKLSKLFGLKLQHCKQLKSLPELPSRIGFVTDSSYCALRQPGLYIFNCPELVDRERCTDMALSCMMQLREVRLFPLCYYHFGGVSPGSEIRRWFNNEHEGNCVSLDASPVMHDHNWIGVAFCAIFVVPHETLSAMSFSERDWNEPFIKVIPVDLYGDVDLELVLDKSDHM
ncbi:TMV resistance protein N [Glycine soja]|uniref:ADP-ribosyl cyclase/cyclic ADP-ribose hydrolase n=1 Tax=Glycine soja TaxID=3848 RepID=A0A445KED9_GLYSO|nr:TMV resistance protein N [Glycine soja]